jgi:uncharacterized protein YlzI (FlbEa/FlbD family)
MTIIQEKLINAYTVLVLAEKRTIEEVPSTAITLEDGNESTIRKEVEITVAEKTVKVLG